MNETNNGLFAAAKRLAGLTLATAHNRVELFAVELREEKCRFVQAIRLTAAWPMAGRVTSAVQQFVHR